jgi:hypothetical protein
MSLTAQAYLDTTSFIFGRDGALSGVIERLISSVESFRPLDAVGNIAARRPYHRGECQDTSDGPETAKEGKLQLQRGSFCGKLLHWHFECVDRFLWV